MTIASTAARADRSRVAIIIPARFASQRYPGKPLALLRGAGGRAKPLIERSWEAASLVSGIAKVLVATDDDRIRVAAEGFGAAVAMTSSACRNGTERCAEALAALPDHVDVIVNLQGDAPLTPPGFVEALAAYLADHPEAEVVTPVVRCTPALHARLLADQAAGRVGGTTAVLDRYGRALYFSKRVLPHVPAERVGEVGLPIFFHVGVYAYRRAALERYAALPPSPLELLEGLEQLRFLEGGISVATVELAPPDADIWELNNPSDITQVEAGLRAAGID
ncbi:3-deoxy-manno-octulosonate cytidylyltransferase [Sphingomonas oleivorans]|uniref:3-deoxy-manno-octulosonate cytidylyltransferase n=1 Tax=Sphingomonas oleivorans TaxID=1735121 RepID=A0A2T5FVD6_9SPHN|nr:3-deoxy-manno-octulosonate cytidylyltransferase [Sphingomonas oleivorans]PTQ09409.1 3-deoxy-manno-octulosonate cytidylyltransferase [Sphingomonas oleivorans]